MLLRRHFGHVGIPLPPPPPASSSDASDARRPIGDITSPRRPWRAIWRGKVYACRPATPRTVWRPPWRARAGVHGPRLVRFTGVQQMRRNLPQRSHYRNWFRTGRSKEGWRIKREAAGGGCTEDTRVNGRRAADQSCGRSRSMGLWLPEAIALYAKTRSLHVVHACGRGIGEPTRDRTHPHPATPAMPVPGRAQR